VSITLSEKPLLWHGSILAWRQRSAFYVAKSLARPTRKKIMPTISHCKILDY